MNIRPLFPTFRALRALRGLKFPFHFWTAGKKHIDIDLHPTALEHVMELPFSRDPHFESDRGFKMPYLSQFIPTLGIKWLTC